jgi:hypothetical protein
VNVRAVWVCESTVSVRLESVRAVRERESAVIMRQRVQGIGHLRQSREYGSQSTAHQHRVRRGLTESQGQRGQRREHKACRAKDTELRGGSKQQRAESRGQGANSKGDRVKSTAYRAQDRECREHKAENSRESRVQSTGQSREPRTESPESPEHSAQESSGQINQTVPRVHTVLSTQRTSIGQRGLAESSGQKVQGREFRAESTQRAEQRLES